MLNNHQKIIGFVSNLLPLQWHCTEEGSKEEARHALRYTEMLSAAKGTLFVERSQFKKKPQHLLQLILVTRSPLGRRYVLSNTWEYQRTEHILHWREEIVSSFPCHQVGSVGKKWNQEAAPWYGQGTAGFALTKAFYSSNSGGREHFMVTPHTGEVLYQLLFQSHQVYQQSLKRTWILTQ